jgi:hypothetical protein
MQGVLHGMTYWRNRAQEARELAEQLTTAEARRIMLDIAESYENLAEGVQQRILAKTTKASPGR